MYSAQLAVGHPARPQSVTGSSVMTPNGALPFLISVSGISSTPATLTGAGFWPVGWVQPGILAEAPARRRVELEHRSLAGHGEGWKQTGAGVGFEGG
jgi:hypothetical protein